MKSVFFILSALSLGVGIGYVIIFILSDTGDSSIIELSRLLCIGTAGFLFAVVFGIFHIALNQEARDEHNNPKG